MLTIIAEIRQRTITLVIRRRHCRRARADAARFSCRRARLAAIRSKRPVTKRDATTIIADTAGEIADSVHQTSMSVAILTNFFLR